MVSRDNYIDETHDLAVLGAGPAGLSIAAACAERGLNVICLAPQPTQRWGRVFGTWAAELAGLSALAPFVEHTWKHPRVYLHNQRGPIALGTAYCKLQTNALQRHLLRRCHAAGVRVVPGTATSLWHGDTGSRIGLRDGRSGAARLVIDATGSGRFVERDSLREPAFQTAYGELIEVADGGAFDPDEMVFMDWRSGDGAGPPSFLYAMPLGPTVAGSSLLFVEETALVRRPAVPIQRLQQRLYARLERTGLVAQRVLGRERCRITMGMPLPRRSQRCVAFGAAASFVHPASGYQLARSMQLAAPTAAVIADALNGGGPQDAARAAYAFMWPRARMRAWELYRFGMDALVDLDAAGTRAFMDAFFALPTATWLSFLVGVSRPTEIVSTMMQVFANARPELRSHLMRKTTGTGSRALYHAALPGNPL